MRRKKLDVKLGACRFTYDPDSLGDFLPVALQSKGPCGSMEGRVFMKLTPGAIIELYEFLERVLCSGFDDRVEADAGSEWVEALKDV